VTPPKTAIVSHVLPPSPSGQAVVLYRLLEGMSPDRYCLISRERYEGEAGAGDASARLPGRYHHLELPARAVGPRRADLLSLRLTAEALAAAAARARRICRIARDERCGLIVGCTGDLLDLPAACLAARWARIPFVPWLFDDYVHQWTGPVRRVARRLEPAIFRRSGGAIAPNEFLRTEYARRRGVTAALVRNPCPMPDLDALDRSGTVFGDGGVHIVYTGAVYRAHYDAFRNLLAAMRLVGRQDARLHIFTAQTGPELAEAGIGGPEVVRHPHIPQSEVPRVLRSATLLFLPLAFDSPIPEVVRTSAPGKTGEYLAAGRPILVHAPADSFVSWYFRANGCGAVADRGEPGPLASAVGALLADGELRARLSREARRVAERDFDVGKIRAEFERALASFAVPGREASCPCAY
jgi:glycosyltransferase involved in cell wall biosynthesis